MATGEQREYWFENLIQIVPTVLRHPSGNVTVPIQDTDVGSGEISVNEVERYLVIERQYSYGDTIIHLASDIKALEDLLSSLISNHEEGEDYGWGIQEVIDLETGIEVDYDVTIRVKVRES